MRTILIVALALVIAAQPALADALVAPLADLVPGDRWEYRKTSGPGMGHVERDVKELEEGIAVEAVLIEEDAEHPTQGHVTSRTEQVVRRQTGDHALVTFGSHATATLAGRNETIAEHTVRVTYDPPLRQFRFPFRVGDAWTARSTETVEREGEADTTRQVEYRVRVVREERIQTIAGFYDTLVVEARDESDGAAEEALERFWWAPSVCAHVQREVEQGGGLVAAYEMVEGSCQQPNLDAVGDANGTPGAGVALAAAALLVALGWRKR